MIIPALIPKDYNDLVTKLGMLNGFTPYIQIDFCDGFFAPTKSWPYSEDSHLNDILEKKQIFPYINEIKFEAHLMVVDPELQVDKFVAFGANKIIVHIESSKNIAELISNFNSKYGSNEATFQAVKLSLAINFETPIESLDEFADKVDSFQLMSITGIGFQGQKFEVSVLEKIKNLRVKYPNHKITVDGGINLENAKLIIEAGANNLVIGSAILNSADSGATLEEFKKVVE